MNNVSALLTLFTLTNTPVERLKPLSPPSNPMENTGFNQNTNHVACVYIYDKFFIHI